VVVAAEAPAAQKLVGKELTATGGTTSATWYFSVPHPAPACADKFIILPSYAPDEVVPADLATSRIVNVGFPSRVQRSYAPEGRDLAAVTVIGPGVTEEWVRKEVSALLGVDCQQWVHIKTYTLSYHQPAQVPLRALSSPPKVGEIFVCGDHRGDPTLDGAMRSGRAVAEAVVAQLTQGSNKAA